ERTLAVMRVLTTQGWPVKIRGKLGAPVVDLSPLGNAGIDLAGKTLDDIGSGRPSLGAGAFQALNEAGIPVSPNLVKSLLELARPKPKPDVVPNVPPTPSPPPPETAAALPPANVPPSDAVAAPA